MEPKADDIDELMAQLLDEDEGRRYEAAFALHKVGRPALHRALAAVADPNPLLREMGCCILGQLGDLEASGGSYTNQILIRDGVPALMHLLRTDPVPEVRAGAAAALGHQKAPEAVPYLCAAVEDPHEDVRFDVACALGSYHSYDWEAEPYAPYQASVRQGLLKLMDDPDDDVRDWATFGIHQGGHDTPETRARLWQALDDPHCDVRGEAVEALALFGDRNVIPILERLLRDPDDLHASYFEAARVLEDPALLPAVEEGAETWNAWLEPGEEPNIFVRMALDDLREIAARLER